LAKPQTPGAVGRAGEDFDAMGEVDESDVQLTLRESAYDFVNAAIREAESADDDQKRWKFAIVHIAQALELILKARLSREHELLVRVNVDRPGRLTVGFDQALGRLAQCGVTLDESVLRRLRSARDLRNDIVHFAVKATTDELKAAFIDLFEFTHVFHLEELGEELHDHIAEDQRYGEAVLMEAFEVGLTTYQGAKIVPRFAAQIVTAQYLRRILIDGKSYQRISFGDEGDLFGKRDSGNCHDCAVTPGQLHVPGCDAEACPRCKGQAITCDCDFQDDETDAAVS
jgi:hypothetical protein